jgi:hypothetical protein
MGYTKEQRDAKKNGTKTDTDTANMTATETIAKSATTMTDNDFRDYKHRWVKFVAELRCYVEGVQLEAGQDITLSPSAAFKQRLNKCIRLDCDVVFPTSLTTEQLRDLDDGDPRIGSTPKDFTLVSQGGK